MSAYAIYKLSYKHMMSYANAKNGVLVESKSFSQVMDEYSYIIRRADTCFDSLYKITKQVNNSRLESDLAYVEESISTLEQALETYAVTYSTIEEENN